MSLLSEYIEKLKHTNAPIQYLEGELMKLIAQYNEKTGRFLFVYSTAISKQVPQVTLNIIMYPGNWASE